MSDEKTYEDDLASMTDAILNDAEFQTPAAPDEDAALIQHLVHVIRTSPNPEQEKTFAAKLGAKFDSYQREQIRLRRLPFYRRYPLGTAAASIVLVAGITFLSLNNTGALQSTAAGADSAFLVIIPMLAAIGLLTYIIYRWKRK